MLDVLDWFPGVPIFFMISGLLVTHSFVRLPTVLQFFQHRALRIYPGLWACLIVSFLLAAAQGDLESRSLFLKTVVWAGLQGTFFQFVNFYVNPGVTNGALWSIATELQFYLALPVMAAVGARYVRNRWHASLIIVGLSVFSAIVHEWTLVRQNELLPSLFPTLYASLLSNGFLFAFGVLAYLWKDKLYKLCRERLLYFLALYVGCRVILSMFGLSSTQVHTGLLCLVVYPMLGLVVYSFAFSWQNLSGQLLKGHDYSFGIYIYHMPVIYAALHWGIDGLQGLGLVSITVGLLAVASWRLVERPALGLKQRLGVSTAASLGTERGR
ncbi:MAG: acyltransferase [Nitrosomonadaceae bacterium]|nr:acyltransferase [Nitrosomonadaceae bacterium]